MLPKNARLTSPQEFARTTKSGLRVTTTHFVGYLYINTASDEVPRAGLIIGKSVGGSVRRHRISRQIRHTLATTLSSLPQGSLLVIRGLKSAGEIDVAGEINEITTRLVKKVNQRTTSEVSA